jgi:hypothetical protein
VTANGKVDDWWDEEHGDKSVTLLMGIRIRNAAKAWSLKVCRVLGSYSE